MDWRAMPPLAALRAFSAFAEAGNLTRAGAALNISHAAVSQQLRALERHIGVALLDRSGRALRLTPDGQHLADSLGLGFGTIAATVQELSGRDADRPLHVSVTPSFASYWLLPRLAGFSQAHPDISLRVDPTPQLIDLAPGGIDLALRHGGGTWPGVESEVLLPAPLIVAGAPALVEGRRIDTPADLVGLPWIEELGTNEASAWLETHGAAPEGAHRRIQLPGNLMLESARQGQGVLITVRLFVEPDLAAGRLVELFEMRADAAYHIVTRPDPLRPAARAFTAWLRREARAAPLGRSNPRAR